jgi:hypothetical protein
MENAELSFQGASFFRHKSMFHIVKLFYMVFNSGRGRAWKDAARSNWTLERELAKCDEAQK